MADVIGGLDRSGPRMTQKRAEGRAPVITAALPHSVQRMKSLE